jgi:ABC-2 type transport system ATP-binding protein
VLQSCDVWPELTVGEALTLFGRYYPAPLPVERTLALVGLSRERDVRAGALSGGQKRRLDVGLALVGDPDLLFLDEPTTGFDPSARHHAWDVIAGLRDLGKAVFLTTHYMDEAEALADRVAVIVDGAIVAEGRPRELGGRARDLVTVRFDLPDGIDATSIPPVPGGVLELCDGSARIRTTRPTETLAALTGWAVAEHLELPRLEARRPSLEDIYLQLSEGR